MRSSLDFKTMGGVLALLATFLLAVPGVKAVRAEDRRAPIASSDGPQCNPGGPEAQVVQRRQRPCRSSRRGSRPRSPRRHSAGEGATSSCSNTRGYNYQAERDLDRIAADLERLSIER